MMCNVSMLYCKTIVSYSRYACLAKIETQKNLLTFEFDCCLIVAGSLNPIKLALTLTAKTFLRCYI